MALLNHPDKRASTDKRTEEEVTKKFQDIVEAYQKLNDPQEKETYDRRLRSKTKQSNVPVSGFITHPVPSLGQKYKSIHAHILQSLITTPQENDLQHSSLDEKNVSEPLTGDIHFVRLGRCLDRRNCPC